MTAPPHFTAKSFVASNVSAAMTAHFAKTDERQGDFAARASISQSSVSKYAAGRITPSSEQAIRIARALGISLSKLILGTDDGDEDGGNGGADA